jgi:hypothetical protein
LEDDRDLARAAMAAVRKAADRLGVNPLALAEWLAANDRLAETLVLLARTADRTEYRSDVERTLREYLAFLEREIEWQRRARGLEG